MLRFHWALLGLNTFPPSPPLVGRDDQKIPPKDVAVVPGISSTGHQGKDTAQISFHFHPPFSGHIKFSSNNSTRHFPYSLDQHGSLDKCSLSFLQDSCLYLLEKIVLVLLGASYFFIYPFDFQSTGRATRLLGMKSKALLTPQDFEGRTISHSHRPFNPVSTSQHLPHNQEISVLNSKNSP